MDNDLLSSSRYAACIATGAAVFIMATIMILLDFTPKWTWSIVSGTIIASWLVTQRRMDGFATQEGIRNAHIFMTVAVVFNQREHVGDKVWFNVALGVFLTGLLGLWLLRDTAVRCHVLVWSLRSCFVASILCTSLAKPESFAIYLDEEGRSAPLLSCLRLGCCSTG